MSGAATELRELTDKFRARLAAARRWTTWSRSVCRAREASKRTVDMRLRCAANRGSCCTRARWRDEDRRRQTLVATMPIYLNALLGAAPTW